MELASQQSAHFMGRSRPLESPLKIALQRPLSKTIQIASFLLLQQKICNVDGLFQVFFFFFSTFKVVSLVVAVVVFVYRVSCVAYIKCLKCVESN
jgi:hypothetical protein